MKVACITGITGQDGSYLAELLLERGYKVYGIIRNTPDSPDRFARITHLLDKITLMRTDYADLRPILEETKPQEIYHLAAQSRVDESFNAEIATFDFNIATTDRLLAAARSTAPEARFYFAATSEMFGAAPESPQNEATPFHPLSPYAVSKTAGFYLTSMYRQAYGLYACSGILFNHESPRHAENFVVRKITRGVARIKLGLQKEIGLGSLDIRRDWGFAGDYVDAMWRMLQQDEPEDFVIGTGTSHSIRDVLEAAFGTVDLDWNKYVVLDSAFLRPLEAKEMVADPGKAKRVLGWQAQMPFEELVRSMVAADLEQQKK